MSSLPHSQCNVPITALRIPEPARSNWCASYGVTSESARYELAVFVIESATGKCVSVNYDCSPVALTDYIKKAVAFWQRTKA